MDDQPALLLLWEQMTARLMEDTRRFPASFRANLAHFINVALLEGLCLLATLPYQQTNPKIERLRELDSILAKLRVLVRQCYTQRALGERGYEAHQARLCEAGRMIGGWLRSLEARRS